MRLRLVLDAATSAALARAAVRELRPLDLQAEVLLRRALGLAVPLPEPGEQQEQQTEREQQEAVRC